MSKICLIRQPAGIGDIFFCQKIAKDCITKGYEVWWPVIPQFEFIKDYVKVDRLNFINENEKCSLQKNKNNLILREVFLLLCS